MKPLILTKAQDQQTRVVLGEFLAMGDEVIVCRNTRDPESLHYTKLPPDGTRAWVVGFTTYFDFHGRVGRYDRKPGVYRRYGAPVFQWIDEAGNEQIGRLHTHHLIWADASLDPPLYVGQAADAAAIRRSGASTTRACLSAICRRPR